MGNLQPLPLWLIINVPSGGIFIETYRSQRTVWRSWVCPFTIRDLGIKQTFQLGGKQLHLMAHLAGAEVGFSEVLEAVVNSASDRY